MLPLRSTPTTATFGFQWETIFDRALANGVGAAYYVSDLPFPALYGPRGMDVGAPDRRSSTPTPPPATLPPICFVDPPFRDGGGGDGISADEHPHGDVRLGQAFMSDVAHAFIEGPQYRRGAMFINYDEWGGFFDHVKPPRVPDDRAQPRRPRQGLVDHRLPGPGGRDLAVHARAAREGGGSAT